MVVSNHQQPRGQPDEADEARREEHHLPGRREDYPCGDRRAERRAHLAADREDAQRRALAMLGEVVGQVAVGGGDQHRFGGADQQPHEDQGRQRRHHRGGCRHQAPQQEERGVRPLDAVAVDQPAHGHLQ